LNSVHLWFAGGDENQFASFDRGKGGSPAFMRGEGALQRDSNDIGYPSRASALAIMVNTGQANADPGHLGQPSIFGMIAIGPTDAARLIR